MPMNEDDEERIAAHLAKTMAMMCVRNTMIEDIHAGLTPVTRTGDYSDVMVIDADGRKIPWPEVSHFGDDTMRDLMKQDVNRLYTFQLLAGVDPSRKSGGALHRLHCFCLEFDGACEVQRRVPTDWIIEPIDVSGYGSFSLAS